MNLIAIIFCTFLSIKPAAVSPAGIQKVMNTGIDSNRYSILPYNKDRDWYRFSNDVEANIINDTLTISDIKRIEVLVRESVKDFNDLSRLKAKRMASGQPSLNNNTANYEHIPDLINTAVYYKQLIAVRNSKGEKEVWVNCFYSKKDKKLWRTQLIEQSPNKGHIFGMKVNLSTDKVTNFTFVKYDG